MTRQCSKKMENSYEKCSKIKAAVPFLQQLVTPRQAMAILRA
jgi:hypothetical protein